MQYLSQPDAGRKYDTPKRLDTARESPPAKCLNAPCRRIRIKLPTVLLLGVILFAGAPQYAFAEDDGGIKLPVKVSIGVEETNSPKEMAGTVKILLFFALLSLVPALMLTMTSFTRIVIVLSFARRALSLQSLPPNQVVIGLSLFLTLFVMAPVFEKMNAEAIQPYFNEEITQAEALNTALGALREFMFKQTREKDIALFVGMAELEHS